MCSVMSVTAPAPSTIVTGTFAALLVAEIAAYAKKNGTTLFEMVDRHIYLDPDVGLFVNRYEPVTL